MTDIFVISMKKSTSRRQEVKNQFGNYGIKFEFFDAVDGNALSEKQKQQVYDNKTAEKYFFSLNNGQTGCALSHLNIYKKMVNENIEHAIICEDDIFLTESFPTFINDMDKYIPNDCDVLLLGHVLKKFLRTQKIFLKNLFGKHKMGKMYPLLGGAHCYYITLEGAKKIIKAMSPRFSEALDVYTRDMLVSKHNLYGIIPQLAFQSSDFESYLSQDNYVNAIPTNKKHYGKLKRLFMIKLPILREKFYSYCRIYDKC